jgi:hypothetical protein
MDDTEKKPRDVFIERQDTVTDNDAVDSGHVNALPKLAASDGDGIVKSRFDELTIRQTIWLFKVSAFYSLIAYTSSVMEGFSVSPPYSPIAPGSGLNELTLIR